METLLDKISETIQEQTICVFCSLPSLSSTCPYCLTTGSLATLRLVLDMEEEKMSQAQDIKKMEDDRERDEDRMIDESAPRPRPTSQHCHQCSFETTTLVRFDGNTLCTFCFESLVWNPLKSARADLLFQLAENDKKMTRIHLMLQQQAAHLLPIVGGPTSVSSPKMPADRKLYFCSCGQKYVSQLTLFQHIATYNNDDHRAAKATVGMLASKREIDLPVGTPAPSTPSTRKPAAPKAPKFDDDDVIL
jgi:hypothetical protein